MRRRDFIMLLSGATAPWLLEARAQQPARKITRIGYLGVASPDEGARGLKAFQTGLRDLGYVEGESYVIDYRSADGRYERLDSLAAELVRLPVDVMLAPTTSAALAARNATGTIPIVFATVSEPVELGIVASLDAAARLISQGDSEHARPYLEACLERPGECLESNLALEARRDLDERR